MDEEPSCLMTFCMKLVPGCVRGQVTVQDMHFVWGLRELCILCYIMLAWLHTWIVTSVAYFTEGLEPSDTDEEFGKHYSV